MKRLCNFEIFVTIKNTLFQKIHFLNNFFSLKLIKNILNEKLKKKCLKNQFSRSPK